MTGNVCAFLSNWLYGFVSNGVAFQTPSKSLQICWTQSKDGTRPVLCMCLYTMCVCVCVCVCVCMCMCVCVYVCMYV